MANIGLMLAHCLRRWQNIKPALGQRPVFTGLLMTFIFTLGSVYILLRIGTTDSVSKLIHLNFQPLEVVDRGSETQPQVVENYS